MLLLSKDMPITKLEDRMNLKFMNLQGLKRKNKILRRSKSHFNLSSPTWVEQEVVHFFQTNQEQEYDFILKIQIQFPFRSLLKKKTVLYFFIYIYSSTSSLLVYLQFEIDSLKKSSIFIFWFKPIVVCKSIFFSI